MLRSCLCNGGLKPLLGYFFLSVLGISLPDPEEKQQVREILPKVRRVLDWMKSSLFWVEWELELSNQQSMNLVFSYTTDSVVGTSDCCSETTASKQRARVKQSSSFKQPSLQHADRGEAFLLGLWLLSKGNNLYFKLQVQLNFMSHSWHKAKITFFSLNLLEVEVEPCKSFLLFNSHLYFLYVLCCWPRRVDVVTNNAQQVSLSNRKSSPVKSLCSPGKENWQILFNVYLW